MLEEQTPHQYPTAGGSRKEEGVHGTHTAEDAEGARAHDGVSITLPGMTAPPFIETGRRGAVGNLLHGICTSLCCVSPSSIVCHYVSHIATSAPAASRTGGKDHTRGCVGVSGLAQHLRFLPLQACMRCHTLAVRHSQDNLKSARQEWAGCRNTPVSPRPCRKMMVAAQLHSISFRIQL